MSDEEKVHVFRIDELPGMREHKLMVRKAQGEGICWQCKLPVHDRIYSREGRREYSVSGMCELCFDAMFAEPEGGEEDEPEGEGV